MRGLTEPETASPGIFGMPTPVPGRWLNYGHFVFESAAQVQGLNKITYVKDVDQREDVLRMVMQGDLPLQVPTPAEDDGT